MAKSSKPVSKREEMRARAIVQRAVNQERERDIVAKRGLIGHCFKYPNRFSDPDEGWWLYAVITGVDEYGRLAAIQFQRNSLGTVSIEPDTYPGLLPQGGWVEIPRSEFVDASVEIANAFLSSVLAAQSVGAVARGSQASTERPRA